MVKKNKKENKFLIIIGLAAVVYFIVFNGQIPQLQSTIGLGAVGEYSMDVDGQTYTLKMDGEDDYYMLYCDTDDQISYKKARDVEVIAEKTALGCDIKRYHKAESGCEQDKRCDDYCVEWGYPAYWIDESSKFCDGKSSNYDSYCRGCDIEQIRTIEEPWYYDDEEKFKRIKNSPSAWFAILVNGNEKAYFGKSTLIDSEKYGKYKYDEKDMLKNGVYRWKDSNGQLKATINVAYRYIEGGKNCYDVLKKKSCTLWGIDKTTSREICLNFEGPGEWYEEYYTERVCQETGAEEYIYGHFIVGDKNMFFCHGHSFFCDRTAKNNEGKPYVVKCNNKCEEYEFLDHGTCKCVDRSNIETREASVAYGREGVTELTLQPGENRTITVLVGLGDFDTEREFDIILDASATEEIVGTYNFTIEPDMATQTYIFNAPED